MTEIIQDEYGQHGAQMLTLAQYADKAGVSSRSVLRWLADGQLPAAVKDEYTGQWRIPANATRTLHAVPAATSQPQDHSQAALALMQGLGGGGGQLAPFVAPAPAEATLRENLDDEPGYLDIETAARYLGIPRAQIRANPERFGLEDVGVKGSMRVPQRVVRRIMGV